MTAKTTPFSNVSKSQVTASLVEQARAIAKQAGNSQFGFRDTKSSPYHTLILTDGGTIENPTNSACNNG